MTRVPLIVLLWTLLAWTQTASPVRQPASVIVTVTDAATRAPLPDAVVTMGGQEHRTDSKGIVRVARRGVDPIQVRAAGYSRATASREAVETGRADVALTPFRPKALYLSVYGVGDRTLRNAALSVVRAAGLNALVIDVKGDRGIVPYRSGVALTAAVGAQRVITVRDLPALLADLRARGVYTIARIVVFKDQLLASGQPALALRKADGSIFRDREGLAWANPYSRAVWDYNIAIAVEAAKAGFDEIQFDYVRLPDTVGVAYGVPWTEENRAAAIDGFLTEARKALAPFNVFLAADVFGYICWNRNDTRIGQKLEHLVGIVDYLSPMLYPSGFQFGIPGHRNPVQHPYEIVRLSLDEARRRAGVPPARFRPWLQAFRDYAFGGQTFDRDEIRAQIKAAEDFGATGWMIWNARNQYSADDLKP